MKKIISDKTRRGHTPIIVLGITIVVLLMLMSIAATANTVAAAGTDKVVKHSSQKVTLHIENQVGSDIVVSWTKADSTKSVFKVKVPDKKTRTLKAPIGKFEQYVAVKQGSETYFYRVKDPRYVQLKSGFEYTSIYKWASGGNLEQINASQAAEIFK